MKFKVLLALLAVFALVAAACGNDDDVVADQDLPAVADDPEPAEEGDEGDADEMMTGLDIDAILAADLDNCEAAPTGDTIKVGMAMDFSEVVGFVDIPGSKLVPFVAELINCTGGINGSPVEVQVQDVGGDAAQAGIAAQDLLDWGANFLIGPPFADFALPILQTTGGQVPLFVAASTEPTLADADNNSYLVSFDDNIMSTAAANWAPGQSCSPKAKESHTPA